MPKKTLSDMSNEPRETPWKNSKGRTALGVSLLPPHVSLEECGDCIPSIEGASPSMA